MFKWEGTLSKLLSARCWLELKKLIDRDWHRKVSMGRTMGVKMDASSASSQMSIVKPSTALPRKQHLLVPGFQMTVSVDQVCHLNTKATCIPGYHDRHVDV